MSKSLLINFFLIQATIIQPIHDLENTGLPTQITIGLNETSTMGPFSPSLVVISEGKAFSVENAHDQKSILALIPKQSNDQSSGGGEPTYWKKTAPTPTPSCLSYKQKDHSKIKYMPCRKEVTFDDELVSPRYYSRPPSRADKQASSQRNGDNSYNNMEDFDAGEYAYLSGSRNSQAFKSPVQRSSIACRESLYGQLTPAKINFMERKQVVVSPVSTVDSSSGVSSISAQSQMGPPSTSASCSQFSEGVGSDHDSNSQMTIAEPRAHYEPLRMLSRRNSVRSYISSHQNQTAEEAQHYQRVLMDEVYGKLKTGKQVSRSESIYSVGNNRQSNGNNDVNNGNRDNREVVRVLHNRSVYEHYSDLASPRCNFASNNPKFQCDNGSNGQNFTNNCQESASYSNNKNNNYDLDDDIVPPIPPPLPILSCVVRKSLSNSDEIQVI